MKILLADIETRPMTVTTWKLFEPRLNHENIITESSLICAAWKWLDGSKVEAVAVDPLDPDNDFGVIQALHEVISAADVFVGHNGDEFDLKRFNARAVFYNFPPLPPILTVDTLKVARRIFGFNSNRLDYLGKFFGVGQKIHTDFSLWLKVMDGDEKALATMVRYNKQDVKLLEAVYLKLRPYMRNHPNENLTSELQVCPTCGGDKFQKRGYKAQKSSIRQQYQCTAPNCGAWFTGKTVKTVEIR